MLNDKMHAMSKTAIYAAIFAEFSNRGKVLAEQDINQNDKLYFIITCSTKYKIRLNNQI